LRTGPRGSVDPAVIFNLDSKLFLDETPPPADTTHHDEVEIATVFHGVAPTHAHEHHHHDSQCVHDRNDAGTSAGSPITLVQLDSALSTLSKETVWRVKGFVSLPEGGHILNWAFGRYDLVTIGPSSKENSLKLTLMGERGEAKRAARKFATALNAMIA
jgi:G3E family GTPase